jgi:HK97 gp10 family phage protein
MKCKFKQPNFRKYLEAIQETGKDIDAAVDQAMLAGGPILLEEMKKNAPIDTHNLQEHVRMIGPTVQGNIHTMEIGIIGNATLTDADTMRYAMAQEFGTASMPAHSFIRASQVTHSKKMYAAIRKSLRISGK